MSVPSLFDKSLLQRRRARAAAQGGVQTFLLERAAEDMADRLQAVQRDFRQILVMGAGSSLVRQAIAPALPDAEWMISMEPDVPLIPNQSGLYIRGDEEFLPFADGAFDLIASALSLQFANDLPGAFIQTRRALKPDGLFLCTMLGGATLQELRASFAQAETEIEGGLSPRVSPMADLRDLGGLLQRAGFALPVADSDSVTVTYGSPLALMHDLRAMGATNVLTARRKTPLRRATLTRAIEIYRENFAEPSGRVRATFEIIHLSGWCPHESQQKPLRPGSAQARLADALGVEEHKLKGR
ncbi:MAG TPA: methyltransferase domain-containing protein [Hyphomicrobiales bacterium]|nr:methyltransferase domain-containing protein [Hyphomicrobiales bacterium]